MIHLFDQIKSEQLQARKNKQTIVSNLLTTLIGEIQTSVLGVKNKQSNEITNEDVLKIIQKFIKNIKDSLTHTPNNETLKTELSLLEAYLPKQLSESEIKDILNTLPDKTNIGLVMKYFKENHNNQYDAKLLTSIIKQG